MCIRDSISHELRSPLTALIGYSNALSEGALGSINNEQGEALGHIVKAANHLKDLINDVLDVSRVDSGKDTTEAEDLELEHLLEQNCKLMMQSARNKDIAIMESFDKESKTIVHCDEKHLRQMLINLLSNAIKYTEVGGTIQVKAIRTGDKVKISIADSGIGISEKDQELIFDRYSSCLLYTSPSPRDATLSRMPSSA